MSYPTPNYALAVMAKSALQFFEANTVLADRQIGMENDTRRFKIGDGVTAWNVLSYAVLGNENSVWIGKSPDSGNLLELTVGRAGFFLNPVTFDGRTVYHQAVDGALTDITPYLTADQQLAGFVAAGLMTRKIIDALGDDWNLNTSDGIPATTVTEAIAAVASSLSDLDLFVGGMINDTVASNSKTYSSTKIESLVVAAVSDLIGSAPGALDTIYELAAALGNNPNLVTNIVTELGETVKYTAQALTEPQMTQARANVGAAAAADLGAASENISTLMAKYLAEKSAAAGTLELDYVSNPLPEVKSSTFVANVIGDGVLNTGGVYGLDMTGGAFVTMMPPSPVPGDEVEFMDYSSLFDVTPAELNPNGKKFMGLNESYFLNQKNIGRRFRFFNEVIGWMPKA